MSCSVGGRRSRLQVPPQQPAVRFRLCSWVLAEGRALVTPWKLTTGRASLLIPSTLQAAAAGPGGDAQWSLGCRAPSDPGVCLPSP